jgi:hypothetical protein
MNFPLKLSFILGIFRPATFVFKGRPGNCPYPGFPATAQRCKSWEDWTMQKILHEPLDINGSLAKRGGVCLFII